MSQTSHSKLPIRYSGRFKGSFAYLTIKDRLPVILVKVLDTLCRDKKSFGSVNKEAGLEDAKQVIGRLSALQNEMITNKPLRELTSDGPDVPLWNNYLDEQNTSNDFPAAWFDSSWIYVECYLYRRIREAFELSSFLEDYDPFYRQKMDSIVEALDDMAKLGQSLLQAVSNLQSTKDLYKCFVKFLEISLWGNKCDLSISAGRENASHSSQVEHLKSKILVNDSEKVWNGLREAANKEVRLDIVLDNAGFELFGDLCLLHFLTSADLVQRVTLHAKKIPWFVSDTLERDVQCLLDTLQDCDRTPLPDLARQWRAHLDSGRWRVEAELFWTLPHDYSRMHAVDPGLYGALSESDLVVFKGDLNYRKLTGDRQWDETTPFETSLSGFLPTALVALRTVKDWPRE